MPRPNTGTKDRILRCAYDLFYREGFSRVSVDAIADASNVTKRTVYYYFRSKDDLVAEALEIQRPHIMLAIQKWGVGDRYTPLELVQNVFEQLQAWASKPGWLGSGFTRITMELADLPGHPARSTARGHKAEVERWFAQQFESMGVKDSEQLARQIMILIEGSANLIMIHGDPSYAAASAKAARKLVAEYLDQAQS